MKLKKIRYLALLLGILLLAVQVNLLFSVPAFAQEQGENEQGGQAAESRKTQDTTQSQEDGSSQSSQGTEDSSEDSQGTDGSSQSSQGTEGSSGSSQGAQGTESSSQSSESAKEEHWPKGLALSSVGESSIVMDVDSGAVLCGYDENTRHYPASITKVMTAMLALEHGNLDDTVTFTKEAVFGIELGSAHIARDVGEEMPLRDCMYGMMLESANECAYAIAEHIGGGSYDTFIDMMNEKAKELGCKDTHFCNSNGLFDENHYTTAYDMALIARAAYENETFAEIVGTKNYKIPPTNIHEEETYLNNHHAMLNYYKTKRYLYEYCVGGKTGYTTEANNTLVTYAKKDGQTLVCVIMNAEQGCHYKDTTRLFDYCFENFDTLFVDEEMRKADLTKIDGAEAFTIEMAKASLEKDGAVSLPTGVPLSDAKQELVFFGEKEDDPVVGELTFSYAGHLAGRINVLYDKAKIVVPEIEGGETPVVEAHRRFEKAAKWVLPLMAGMMGMMVLLFFHHLYDTAPYHRYYGSKFLRNHFRKKRRRRKRRRSTREE